MTPRERLFALEQFGIKLGLDNIVTLVTALNRPDRRFSSVHVAGTNGKGSVTAMVERGLHAAGCRTGRYTSPHLVDIEERVAIDGKAVSRDLFDETTADVLGVVDALIATGRLPGLPTFFEVTTAIALEIFSRAQVDAAVIEVGLGGRFDATNVIAPAVTAITSIAFDHQRHLGSTLAAIASEKAGIIKHKTPLVVGELPEEADTVVAEVARECEAPVVRARPAKAGSAVTLRLNGGHQRANAAVAVEVLRQWPGHTIRREHLVTALTDVEWPARLEWLRVPELGDVLIDAAHNPNGARALADYVLETTGPLPMVVGVMRDKDVPAILREVAPAVSRFIPTTVSSPRAMPAADLAALVRNVLPAAHCEPNEDALDAVRAACRAGSRAMIAGSIFLAGPVRAALVGLGATPVRYPSKSSLFYLD